VESYFKIAWVLCCSRTVKSEYETVSVGGFCLVDGQDAQTRESLRDLIRDPVTKTLLRNSQLTETQLETLLVDSFLAGGMEKAQRRLYRSSKDVISRGSYNRTLIQAQTNVIRSIYTILLLGYLKLFDSASLQPFLELADTIDSYVSNAKDGSEIDRSGIEHLNRRLLEFIMALAKRDSFKDVL